MALRMSSQMDMTLAMTQGLQNAPKLLRIARCHMHKVTGVGSGLKTASKVRKLANQLSFDAEGRQELALVVYDGFSGFVMQPGQGWKKGGSAGMYKVIGKGVRGILLKPFAGQSQRV